MYQENFTEMSIVNLLHYLFDAYQYLLGRTLSSLHKNLDQIQKNTDKISPEIKEVISTFTLLEGFLKEHFKKEKEFLYTGTIEEVLKNLPFTIDILAGEHEIIKLQLKTIRKLSSDYNSFIDLPGLKLFYAQLFNLEQDIHKHIFLQEDILFPKLKLAV